VRDSLLSRYAFDHEMRLVAAFFGNIKGYFVEVGANDPQERLPTWRFEQAGWTGVLIEPQPDLVAKLRTSRRAKIFEVALLLARKRRARASSSCGRPAAFS
jgi:hypothetical protein